MMNEAKLIGRLGKDPEMRYTPGGQPVCNFSMATSERYKNKDGDKVEKTEWHECVRFGPGAEALGEYLKKGSRVYVAGQIETNAWEDKDGNKHSKKIIKIAEWEFLDSKQAGETAQADPTEDVPF